MVQAVQHALQAAADHENIIAVRHVAAQNIPPNSVCMMTRSDIQDVQDILQGKALSDCRRSRR